MLTNTLSLNNNIPLDGYWKNDSFFTGKNVQIGKISGYVEASSSSNNFSIFLNKTYNNVAEIKIVSSIIPNVQKNIIGGSELIDSTNIYTNKTNGSWYVPCDSLILRNSKTNESFSYIIDSYKLISVRNRLDYCSISNGYTGIHYL